ncbi:hypothetical protein [Psychrobacter sp. WY6]|uniref:hypothetical protein n=1 Tax=Psychrobacter sp. WY6 TaxID=2708350 RepID=UPI002022F1E9|nr:hypothetical protein [Psychrobacter sp. WY6]
MLLSPLFPSQTNSNCWPSYVSSLMMQYSSWMSIYAIYRSMPVEIIIGYSESFLLGDHLVFMRQSFYQMKKEPF